MNIDEVINQENEKIHANKQRVRNLVILSVSICCIIFSAVSIGIWHFYFESRLESKTSSLQNDYQEQISNIIKSDKDAEPEPIVIVKEIIKESDNDDEKTPTTKSTDTNKAVDVSQKTNSVDNSNKADSTKVQPIQYTGLSGTISEVASSHVGKNKYGWEFVQDVLIASKYPTQKIEGYDIGRDIVPFMKYGKSVSTDKNTLKVGDILMFGNVHEPISADYMGFYVGDNKVIMSENGKIVKVNIPENINLTKVIRLP